MALITNHMHNEDVVDQRQAALGPLLAIIGGGWVALLVGSLIYREITKGELFGLPFFVTLGALLAATVVRGKRWPRVAAWLLVAGLLAGPACFALRHSSNPAVLVLLALPVVAASMLLPRAATWVIAALSIGLMALLASFTQPGEPPPAPAALVLALATIMVVAAAMLYYHAANTGALIDWATDSQRKDARRAELFRQQQEQLRLAIVEIEDANVQLRRLNIQLDEARRIAETASQLKTRFLANVSHELRAPLHIILGLSEAALAAPARLSSDMMMHEPELKHIQRSGKHLQRLIDDLLDLSRAEINALEIYPETIDASVLLADVFAGMADSREPGSRVHWRIELPERLPLIQVDPVRLRQMLFNLLSNAGKFTAEGSITLGTAIEPPYLHLWVADTGRGIALDQQERIFEPFNSDARRGRPDGVGLGLSITRRLVALHQGVLTLESQPGEGSSFHIYLPLPDASGQPARLPDAAMPALLLLAAQPQPPAALLAIATRQQVPLLHASTINDLQCILATYQPIGIAWDLASSRADDWPLVQYVRANPALCCVPLLLFSQAGGPLPDLTLGLTGFLVKPVGAAALAQQLAGLHDMAVNGPILIVDDDPAARASYRAVLGRAFPQQSLIEAADGAAALAVLAHERPAFIMLDLMMPEVDGFTVLEELRANPATRQTPVLVLSGRMLSLDDVQRLRKAQVTLHTKQTLDEDELLAQIGRIHTGENTLAPATSAVVKQAIGYMHTHYAHAFSRGEIAATVGVSERYLTDIFHQEMGISLWEYLNRLRVAQARDLLLTTDASIGEVATQVGFDNAHYFARMFRRLVGMSPSAYRQQPIPAAPVE